MSSVAILADELTERIETGHIRSDFHCHGRALARLQEQVPETEEDVVFIPLHIDLQKVGARQAIVRDESGKRCHRGRDSLPRFRSNFPPIVSLIPSLSSSGG